jgi:D-alanyl-D-alanine dipeptidase
MPDDFISLHEADPSIIIDLRYRGQDNFLGRPVASYSNSNKTVLTKEAAEALSKAQKIFNKDGYSIVLYDAYRAQDAVDDFVNWAEAKKDQAMKKLFYPRLDKEKVFELGYIAKKSSHSRGSTVDISIIPLQAKLHSIKPSPRKLKDGFEIQFLDDGTLDMGSSFDLFDQASHYENDLITDEQKSRRAYLRKIMEQCGFMPYAEEWWHFTLANEPYPDQYFNFHLE